MTQTETETANNGTNTTIESTISVSDNSVNNDNATNEANESTEVAAAHDDSAQVSTDEVNGDNEPSWSKSLHSKMDRLLNNQKTQFESKVEPPKERPKDDGTPLIVEVKTEAQPPTLTRKQQKQQNRRRKFRM